MQTEKIDQLLKTIEKSGKKSCIVTKYLSKEKTHILYSYLKNINSFSSIGENKINKIEQLNISKNKIDFIGNLQSNKLKFIARHCQRIHSLWREKHLYMLEKNEIPIEVFVQVNTSGETQKGGLLPEALPSFLSLANPLKHVTIVGLSSMGKYEFTEEEKHKEFQLITKLRDTHLPGGLVSAGTSVDWHIALQHDIDILRIGTLICQHV